ncbi:unnamed protein product, partial [Didymodactylos carnosus]
IASSYDRLVAEQLNKILSHGLATAFSEILNESTTSLIGMRDYYSLIKSVAKDVGKYNLNEDDSIQIFTIIKKYMKKYFDQLRSFDISPHEKMWIKFCKETNHIELLDKIQLPTTKSSIDSSIQQIDGRYLMLIIDKCCVQDYFESYIIQKEVENNRSNVFTLIGSQMALDINNNTYVYHTISDSILNIENGSILILKKMNNIYSSLYDLFNQNFIQIEDKYYCRIAMGNYLNPQCHVNKLFYCVIIIDHNDFKHADVTFLNRFEKHIIHLENIMDNCHLSTVKAILDWIESFKNINQQHYFTYQHLIVNFNQDYLAYLVLKAYEHYNS